MSKVVGNSIPPNYENVRFGDLMHSVLSNKLANELLGWVPQVDLIEGIKVTPLKQIGDDRGKVMHMLRNDSKDFVKFGECYFSEVLSDSIKAWKKHT